VTVLRKQAMPPRTLQEGGTARVLHAHTGAEFESGAVHAARGRNEPHPGVEPEPAGPLDADDGARGGMAGTGLAGTRDAAGKVRKPAQTLPARMGPVWATVRVVGREYTTNPNLVCKGCDHTFSGGVERIEDHILSKCTCSTDALVELKARITAERAEKAARAERKRAFKEVEAAAKEEAVPKGGAQRQRSLEASFATGKSDDMDAAIAEMVYGDNLSFAFTESPRFQKVLNIAKTVPLSYQPPSSVKIGGLLLHETTRKLRHEEEPLRKACTVHGSTVVSDGWDDVEKSHLINFLVATTKGAFFDGTVKLAADDHEDATAVANHIISEIEHVGPLTVVQVVTDTCAVMKAAWKIIEARFPWITCTCCAPHVLSLLVKDISKIPEVDAVIKKEKKVLNRFWGRKRWCRGKLREVVFQNHKKKLGLYRAAPTRFAGHVREMGRMLRLKAELKYIVDLPDYAKQDFKKKSGGEEPDDDTDGEGGVRKILLDEAGFWEPLVAALKILTPVVVLLRLCDSQKPAMGKVYDRMFLLKAKAEESTISWAPKAVEKIEARWEYLHSFMHGAGYAFDPEFLEMTDQWDEAITNGAMEIIERLCLRECMLQNKGRYSNPLVSLTTTSEEVVEMAAACELELSTFKKREGIFTKATVLLNAKRMEPAAWWDMYGKHLPILSSVAKSVLAQVVCASAAERNWSVYGQIKSIGRSRLGHETSDKLVYCHEALALREKLQKASYKPSVEKWESDSDSGESDEEDLNHLMQ
jgi:hypothetical protein